MPPFLHSLTLIAALASLGLQANAKVKTGGNKQGKEGILSDKEPQY